MQSKWEAGSSRYDKDISIYIYMVDQGGGGGIYVYFIISCIHTFFNFTIYGEVNYVSFEHKQCNISMIVFQSYVL